MQQEVAIEVANRITETNDDFIFTTIMESGVISSEIIISKEILKRALICFQTEHSEEYSQLIKESVERNKKNK